MKLTFFSFFLNSEEAEAFLEINSNFLETNVINIFILLALLIYGYKVSFSRSLETRQKEIAQTIENAQNDVLNATNYYYLAEKGFSQSFFWLQSWKTLYENDKMEIVHIKYKQIKTGLEETFLTTENLIGNFEKKAFLSLQRYILFLTASRIFRQFLLLPELQQSQLIETTILKLEEFKE
jgi:F0F1-type ATP synthase membrane subunit b/b'